MSVLPSPVPDAYDAMRRVGSAISRRAFASSQAPIDAHRAEELVKGWQTEQTSFIAAGVHRDTETVVSVWPPHIDARPGA